MLLLHTVEIGAVPRQVRLGLKDHKHSSRGLKCCSVHVRRDAYKDAGGWDKMPQHWKMRLVVRTLDDDEGGSRSRDLAP